MAKGEVCKTFIQRFEPARRLMKYCVYVLLSENDQKRYVGFTKDLNSRISEHSRGLVKSTKNRRPLKLIHFEEFELKSAAMKRERFLKSGQGRDFLSKLEV